MERQTLSIKMQMVIKKILLTFYLLPFTFYLLPSTASALPGQSVNEVSAWIKANPTLQPGIGNSLRVTKNSTPAQRFTFQASVLPPGRVAPSKNRGRISSERMSFYDAINGVTIERLRESLRVIYGPTIYKDYDRAQIVYDYPVAGTLDLARRQNRKLLTQQQGELRLGERFGYWLEITKTDSDKAFSGQIIVFLKDDLEKLEAELRDR